MAASTAGPGMRTSPHARGPRPCDAGPRRARADVPARTGTEGGAAGLDSERRVGRSADFPPGARVSYTGPAFGAVAQLVAHLHGMQRVRGSSPLSSTTIEASGCSRRPRSSCWACRGGSRGAAPVAMRRSLSTIKGFVDRTLDSRVPVAPAQLAARDLPRSQGHDHRREGVVLTPNAMAVAG